MLSKRLEKIRSYHGETESIWDIGCDHGDLGLSFVNYAFNKEIFLVDSSEEVIKSLSKKVEASYIANKDKIKVINSEGQKLKIESDHKKSIFISGMGGKEIGEILFSFLKKISINDTFIISPHRKILELRDKLSQSSFRLKDEVIFYENNQFYQIISLTLNPRFPNVSPFGRLEMWSSEEAQKHLQEQILNFSKHKDLLSKEYVSYLKSISY